MYALTRPVLFRLPPPVAHELGMAALAPLEHLGWLRAGVGTLLAPARQLERHVMGLRFPGPVGIAAGFDKNGRRARALAALGFGHVEVGTVTAIAQEGNPPPNLFRLPDDRALVNRLGFPNEGAATVARRLTARRSKLGVPLGVSIGKSRVVPLEPLERALADYVESFRAVRDVADFVVVNVSSPNTKDLRAMQAAALARELFRALLRENRAEGSVTRPILVKIAPDLDDAELEALLAVVDEEDLAGVVATNTTVSREGLRSRPERVRAMGPGGLSGPPLRARSLEVVHRVRARLGEGVALIGAGGIETADDARAYLDAGADLVQMYTGFVYRGPLAAWSIHRSLAAH